MGLDGRRKADVFTKEWIGVPPPKKRTAQTTSQHKTAINPNHNPFLIEPNSTQKKRTTSFAVEAMQKVERYAEKSAGRRLDSMGSFRNETAGD